MESANGPIEQLTVPAVFTHMQASFESARSRRPDGFRESYYSIASQSVCLRLVGGRLSEHISRPFAHLQTHALPSATPQLTVDLWDEEATGIPCPIEPVPKHLGPRALITASPDSRFVGYQRQQTVTWFDRVTTHIIGWVASSDRLSLSERGKPLLFALSLWQTDEGGQVIHAGLVSRNGQGVLFAGSGGAGKSTSALACVCAGFDYLGDDYIGLRTAADGSFVGHSLYNSSHLEPNHLERFPVLIPHAIQGPPPEQDKVLILLSQIFPMQLERGVPIRAMALPRVTDRAASRIRPASKGDAFLALAPSSILILPRHRPRGVKTLRRLVEQVPTYWLELGPDIGKIPCRVEELLAEATRA